MMRWASFALRPNQPLSSTLMAAASMSTASKLELVAVSTPRPFVAHVQLNRPDKMNSLNLKLWSEIGTAFQDLADDPECRAIVLSGNGKLFCAGIDLNELASMATVVQSDDDIARKAKALYKKVRTFQDYLTLIEKCPKPVIAAIHNGCVGAGVDMITCTDIRLCTKDAWFQVKEVEAGLAADVGTLQRLPKVIGSQSLVRELCFTARKFMSDEAESSGLVSRVYNDKDSMLASALDLAENIAQKSPVAVQGTKIQLNYSRDHSVDESLEYIARWSSIMLQSDDILKAGMALITRAQEPPTFSKL